MFLGQSKQDEFVIKMLNFKKNGYFLESRGFKRLLLGETSPTVIDSGTESDGTHFIGSERNRRSIGKSLIEHHQRRKASLQRQNYSPTQVISLRCQLKTKRLLILLQ